MIYRSKRTNCFSDFVLLDRFLFNKINPLKSTVYSKLAKLYSEWKGYIVPEAVSLLQIEEATGLIDSIINLAYSQPISKLSSHLSSVLQTGQSDTVTEQYLETTKFLETQFEALCGGVAESSETPGIMLIKLCNQMFGDITVRVTVIILYCTVGSVGLSENGTMPNWTQLLVQMKEKMKFLVQTKLPYLVFKVESV